MTKLTVEISDELLAKLDEWIESHVEFKPTREEALAAFTQQRLAPLAAETATGQFQMAQRWQVGLAELPAGSRPCLILTPAAGPGMMMLLDDSQAVEISEQLVEIVKARGPGPSGVPQ